MSFLVVRSYVDANPVVPIHHTSETLFATREEADAHIREMVELNPNVELDFFVKELTNE